MSVLVLVEHGEGAVKHLRTFSQRQADITDRLVTQFRIPPTGTTDDRASASRPILRTPARISSSSSGRASGWNMRHISRPSP